MTNTTPSSEVPQDFKILFEKLEEVKAQHGDLFVFGAGNDLLLPESVQEIKKIVEACNENNTQSTFTRV